MLSSPAVAAKAFSDGKSASNTRSTLLVNQPSVSTASNKTAESASSTTGGFGDELPTSRKKDGVKRGPKSVKKPDKSDHHRKAFPSFGTIQIKILVISTATATGGSVDFPSSAVVPAASFEDGDSFEILPRSSFNEANDSNWLIVCSVVSNKTSKLFLFP